MTALKLIWTVTAAMTMALLATQANAQTTAKKVIVVSLEDRKLALIEDGQVKKIYSVAVGKPSTPSPVGEFTIERRATNPTYHHDGKTVLPGPSNPVGTRWMGLSMRGYGIHGTNEPKSIGKAASHGCIRMAKADLEEFYELVAVGDTVELIGERNEETAQLVRRSGRSLQRLRSRPRWRGQRRSRLRQPTAQGRERRRRRANSRGSWQACRIAVRRCRDESADGSDGWFGSGAVAGGGGAAV